MTGHQQPKHRAKPMCGDHCHLNCVSLGLCVDPEGHAPLWPPCDRKLLCACVGMVGHALGMYGAVRGPHLESHGFPDMRSAPQMTREREAWRPLSASPGILFKTWSEHKYVWAPRLNVNCNQLNYNLIVFNIYIKMFRSFSGLHWHNLKLNMYMF